MRHFGIGRKKVTTAYNTPARRPHASLDERFF
jgi:hypothetical protein